LTLETHRFMMQHSMATPRWPRSFSRKAQRLTRKELRYLLPESVATKNYFTRLHPAAQMDQVDVARLLIAKGAKVNAKSKLAHFTIMSISQKREDSIVLREEGGDESRPQVREAVSKLQFSFVLCVLDSCSGSSRFREMNLIQIMKS
jgi:hypothetical protein